jgi:hypothetical protein
LKKNFNALLKALPNYGGTMLVNGQECSYSYLELSKPTGKYIARIVIKCVNIFMAKHYFRFIGNSCSPGLVMSEIIEQNGIQQFQTSGKGCGLIVCNVFGNNPVKDGVVIPADPFMIVNLDPAWQSINDYKAAMTSKYRIRTNKVYELSNQITFKKLNDDGLEKWIPVCAVLLFETLKHKTITIGSDLALVLRTYHQQLGDNYQINGYFKGDQLIGFISFIRDGDQMYAIHLGYNLSKGTKIHLYQRMMYDLIGICIEKEVKSLNLGRTAPEIKSTMGAIPIENSFVFFSRSKSFKWLIQYYANKIHKPLQYTLRHPFKTS